MVHLSALLAFWAFHSLASANWNRENMDPAQADPLSSITCVGPLPGFKIPGYLMMPGVVSTLQLMCAQTQYGGNPRGHNAGGFCQERAAYVNQVQPIFRDGEYVAEIERGNWEFRIDPHSLRGQLGNRKLNLRFSRYCQMRCTCTGVPAEQRALVAYQDPLPIQAPISVESLPQIVDLGDLENNVEATYSEAERHQQLLSRIGSEVVPVIYAGPDLNGLYSTEARPITISYKNKIECEENAGALQGLPFPPPARRADYFNIINLCAVYLSGGRQTMNFGGFCKQNALTGESFVAFSDEMTPVADWTFRRPGWSPNPATQLSAIHIRRFCYNHCKCAHSEKKPSQQMALMWDLLEAYARPPTLEPQPDQSQNPKAGNTPAQTTRKSSIKRFLGRLTQQSAGFLPSDLEPSSWVDVNARAGPLDFEPGECETPQCDFPGDCITMSTDACPYQPACVVDPSTRKSRVNGGLSNVIYFAIAVCLPKHTRPNLNLNGRGLENATDTSDWPCACNSTYVSHGCCSSPDGMIWEATHLMLGELKV